MSDPSSSERSRSRRRPWKLAIGAFVVAALLGAGGWAGYRRGLVHIYPSRTLYPVRGIDVSHHQGRIRWAELDTGLVRFAIVKATEGGDYRDRGFRENVRQARARGLAVGAYHFYRLCTPPRLQAENFLSALAGADLQLPPTVDLEYGGNCADAPSREASLRDLREFLDTLRSRTGARPILYSTNEFYRDFLAGNFEDCSLWIRDLFRAPELPDGRPWTLWQYANAARLPGIDTPVDLDAMSRADFDGLLASLDNKRTTP